MTTKAPTGDRRQPPAVGPESSGGSARIAWFATLGAQTERNRPASPIDLAPPSRVRAERGRGHVTISWSPVEGAAGYLVHRALSAEGPFEPIDHGGGDVLAVPHGPYVDTTGDPEADAWYAVGSLATIESNVRQLSRAVSPETVADTGHVEIDVDAGAIRGPLPRPWRPIIGSEHLAMLLRGPGPGGSDVGEELAEAFRIARRELGVESVRAHGILHDSLGVYREVDGRPVHDFGKVDEVLDRLLETGLRPIVELSFVPRDLASDPGKTVFDYRGIISPPRDMARWEALCRDLTAHLAERYGHDEVRCWAFEVWNEANIQVFWTGSEADYFELYDATARAVKSVDKRFHVGGPATAAAGWIDDLLAHCDDGIPLDFLSTHTYGAPPLDLRPIAERFGRRDIPLWWTEWGVSPTHGSDVNDSVWGAPLVCRGMRSAAGRLESLAYWVASDHFVELGEAPRLFHGGFGLLTIGNLRKPRFWAISILEQLGADELVTALSGDGAGGLVEAWASRDPDGRVAVAIWNGTLDQSKTGGDARLARDVKMAVDRLPARSYTLRHRRLDLDHSNIQSVWRAKNGGDWPDAAGWAHLRAADRLEDFEPERRVEVTGGRLDIDFDLPMPAVSLVELLPEG
jgi:xylan 1,4-beta-xylosidase